MGSHEPKSKQNLRQSQEVESEVESETLPAPARVSSLPHSAQCCLLSVAFQLLLALTRIAVLLSKVSAMTNCLQELETPLNDSEFHAAHSWCSLLARSSATGATKAQTMRVTPFSLCTERLGCNL